MDEVAAFYDAMSDDYHALYVDWDASVRRQGDVIGKLIRTELPDGAIAVLDATCGIGTQAIGLALAGYEVTATDVSAGAIERARREATRLGASVEFGVADIRRLPDVLSESFDVVISFDNALPHLLERADLDAAVGNMLRVLRPGGLLLTSIRDYDAILEARPGGEHPRLTGQAGSRAFVAQAWVWDPVEPRYRLHQFVVKEQPNGDWTARHFETGYRAVRRAELEEVASQAGFASPTWLEPRQSGFYQPILRARRGSQASRRSP